jgi:hypothetical protein
MTTLTFLGASGGAGTTTVAALSWHLLAETGLRLPAVVTADTAGFTARLGYTPPAVAASGNELIDGGRYSAGKAAASGQGWLVLVGAHTRNGEIALQDALADLTARLGPAGLERTWPVLCAAFGPSRPTTSALPAVHFPFDRRLAAGAAVAATLPQLQRRSQDFLRRQWLPLLRHIYASP